jgi:hypothetical protein
MWRFETRNFARPVAILMTNGMVHMDVFSGLTYTEDIASKAINFALPDATGKFGKIGGFNQLIRFAKVAKNTSFGKEFRCIRQTLNI